MTNYNNGKIYIGSTTKELLSQRTAAHNSQYKAWKKGQAKRGAGGSVVYWV